MCEFFNNTNLIKDEIVEITELGYEDTLDIETDGNHLFFANDLLTHNSSVEEIEFDHSHISGGISKIQTADNVLGIFTSRAMRERGRYQLQLMKTRSSSGVGSKVDLAFDVDTLRITDGEAGEDDSTTTAQNIVNQVRRNPATEPAAPVRAKPDSARLRAFIDQLGGE